LAILKAAADYSQEPDWFERTETKNLKVKSGFMLGLGETFSEILETLQDLKKVGVHYVTIGQYLQPSFKHLPIQQFYSEDEFKTINTLAKDCGFEKVFCGPLIRSSFHAEELV
jgi:lipoic acid synthetase